MHWYPHDRLTLSMQKFGMWRRACPTDWTLWSPLKGSSHILRWQLPPTCFSSVSWSIPVLYSRVRHAATLLPPNVKLFTASFQWILFFPKAQQRLQRWRTVFSCVLWYYVSLRRNKGMMASPYTSGPSTQVSFVMESARLSCGTPTTKLSYSVWI